MKFIFLVNNVAGYIRNLFTIQPEQILEKIIKDNNYTSYAEIGVWRGNTIKYLLKHCKLKKVICVDSYKTDPIIGVSKDNIKQAKADAMKMINNPVVRFITKDSVSAAKSIEDNSLDLVYIDANHSYESVKKDIEEWLPKVRKGGILAGHDLGFNTLGVALAVNEKFVYSNVFPCNVWFYKKGKYIKYLK